MCYTRGVSDIAATSRLLIGFSLLSNEEAYALHRPDGASRRLRLESHAVLGTTDAGGLDAIHA